MTKYFFKNADKATFINEKNIFQFLSHVVEIYLFYDPINRKNDALSFFLLLQVVRFLFEILSFAVINAV